jgi:hypothetical protein
MDDVDPADDFQILNQLVQVLKTIPPARRRRVLHMLDTLFNLDGDQAPNPDQAAPTHSERSAKVPFSQDLSPTPKQFLLEKEPRTDVERIACLAYYLTHYRDMPHFKTIDLNKLNTEAAQQRLSNPTY